MRMLTAEKMEQLDLEYIYDPFVGAPMMRAPVVAAEFDKLLVDQSIEAFQLFLGGPRGDIDPAWLTLLHHKVAVRLELTQRRRAHASACLSPA